MMKQHTQRYRNAAQFTVGIFALLLGAGSCIGPHDEAETVIAGRVLAGITPVSGAEVFAEIYDNGQMVQSSASVVSDPDGNFFITDLGPAFGLIEFRATGGVFFEPWADDVELEVSRDLRSALSDVSPGNLEGTSVVISPFTTLASTFADARMRNDELATREYSVARSYRLMNDHLGTEVNSLDIAKTLPADLSTPSLSLNPEVHHAIALSGLSYLAWRIAENSQLGPSVLNTLHVLYVLRLDLSAGPYYFDGFGPEGPLWIGDCDPCPSSDPCFPVCVMDANTLRAHLASAILYDFFPTLTDQPNLTNANFRPIIDHIWRNTEPEMFGAADEIEFPQSLEMLARVCDEEISSLDACAW